MSKASLAACSRCGEYSMEHFKTYSHCFQCLHIVDPSMDQVSIIPTWAMEEFKNVSHQFETMMARLNGNKTPRST